MTNASTLLCCERPHHKPYKIMREAVQDSCHALKYGCEAARFLMALGDHNATYEKTLSACHSIGAEPIVTWPHHAIHPVRVFGSCDRQRVCALEQVVLHFHEHQFVWTEGDSIHPLLSCWIHALIASPISFVPPVHPLKSAHCTAFSSYDAQLQLPSKHKKPDKYPEKLYIMAPKGL